MAPAPRKPIPVTICAAMRVGSARMTLSSPVRKPRKPYAEAIVKSAEPTETSMCVRKPASRSRSSRSIPTAPPSAAASASRRRTSSHESDGTLAARSIESLPLGLSDPADPLGREIEERRELVPAERRPLGGRLHLDEPPRPGLDDVQVDLRARVLHLVELEQPLPADDPERNGR